MCSMDKGSEGVTHQQQQIEVHIALVSLVNDDVRKRAEYLHARWGACMIGARGVLAVRCS